MTDIGKQNTVKQELPWPVKIVPILESLSPYYSQVIDQVQTSTFRCVSVSLKVWLCERQHAICNVLCGKGFFLKQLQSNYSFLVSQISPCPGVCVAKQWSETPSVNLNCVASVTVSQWLPTRWRRSSTTHTFRRILCAKWQEFSHDLTKLWNISELFKRSLRFSLPSAVLPVENPW